MSEESEIEYDGKCLLCNKELKEEYHSGSYQTYLKACDCKDATNYYELHSSLRVIINKASKNKDEIKKKEEIKQLKEKLKRLES